MTEIPSILIVDDTPANLSFLTHLLRDHYKVRVANNGETALTIVQQSLPDLILLDIVMPGMDGWAVIRALKEAPATREIPVIFITGRDDRKDELDGFELGAVDYITKPLDGRIVLARVQTQMALAQAKQTIARQNQHLQAEKALVEDILIRMQKSPQFCPQHLRALMSPVERTNGDILLSALTPDLRQWILVGDMTGHGLPAALSCPLVSHIFYQCAEANRAPEEALREINDVMYTQLPLSLYMAATLVEITPDRRNIRIWNGGLPDNLLYRPGEPMLALPSNGLPLGIHNDPALLPEACLLDAPPGSRLYVYSDGVTEIENEAGEALGSARLSEYLCQFSPQTKDLNSILDFLEHYRHGDDFKDDITLVEISLGQQA